MSGLLSTVFLILPRFTSSSSLSQKYILRLLPLCSFLVHAKHAGGTILLACDFLNATASSLFNISGSVCLVMFPNLPLYIMSGSTAPPHLIVSAFHGARHVG